MVRILEEKKDTTGFGKRLRAIRAEKGLTQESLGQLAGMRYQVVARLERGDRTPSWETVLKLAKALGVSTEEFVDPDAGQEGDADEPPAGGGGGKPRRPKGGK